MGGWTWGGGLAIRRAPLRGRTRSRREAPAGSNGHAIRNGQTVSGGGGVPAMAARNARLGDFGRPGHFGRPSGVFCACTCRRVPTTGLVAVDFDRDIGAFLFVTVCVWRGDNMGYRLPAPTTQRFWFISTSRRHVPGKIKDFNRGQLQPYSLVLLALQRNLACIEY